jgi:hypothetical protein
MRTFLLLLCGALVGAGALVAADATSPVKIAMSPGPSEGMSGGMNNAALGKNIRAYLMANPEVLVDAMAELERKQDS